MLIVNPGADIAAPTAEAGWTNTFEGAQAEARRWLDSMREEGIHDVELLDSDGVEDEGRWTFTFRHTVTGVEVRLDTHGIDNYEAYKAQHIFAPRVYWNGSSCGNPELSDFAADGYVQTFRATA